MEENKVAVQSNNSSLSVFGSVTDFESCQRMAVALSKSTIVPKDYINNPSNTLVALDMSYRLKTSPMMVMQNLYIINGRPSWSSQFIIAMINNSGRFAMALKFKMDGIGDALSCFAYTVNLDGEEVVGPKITYEMAKKEGWTSKSGSKWATMPEIMIRYRAASFFGRLHCSDLLMGIYSKEENVEMINVDYEVDIQQDVKEEVKQEANKEIIDIPTVDAEIVETKEGGEDAPY